MWLAWPNAAGDCETRRRGARQLEAANARGEVSAPVAAKEDDGMQLRLFQLDDPVLAQVRDEILNLDIDNLTPCSPDAPALHTPNHNRKIKQEHKPPGLCTYY